MTFCVKFNDYVMTNLSKFNDLYDTCSEVNHSFIQSAAHWHPLLFTSHAMNTKCYILFNSIAASTKYLTLFIRALVACICHRTPVLGPTCRAKWQLGQNTTIKPGHVLSTLGVFYTLEIDVSFCGVTSLI